MATSIRLNIDGQALEATLGETGAARAIVERLPLTFRMSRWGEEYYGDIGPALGVGASPDAREIMEVGELAYWIPGNALCIFFGPTPASEGDEPRAASSVEPVGRLTSGIERLRGLGGSVSVQVELAS